MARRRNVTQLNETGIGFVDGFVEQNAAQLGIQLSDNTQLAGVLGGFVGAIDAAAEANIARQIEEEHIEVTALERRSMVRVEAFKQVSGLDLTALMMRAYYLRIIQEENLLTIHPSGAYSTLGSMASANGCSVTEMTFILDAVNIIFPYLAENLGLSIWDVWAGIGKSKLKELTPILKAMITGEASDTATTAAAVQRLLQETFDGMEVSELYSTQFEMMADERIPNEERQEIQNNLRQEAVRITVEHLVDVARDLPNEELRRHLRPGTEAIEFYEINYEGRRLVAAEMDEGQLTMLRNRLRERVSVNSLTFPDDPQARQAEAMRVPFLRRIANMVRGS